MAGAGDGTAGGVAGWAKEEGAAWFGAYAKDHVALALEYPPAFTSLVYTACKTPVMKKSGIGQVVDRLNKGTRTKDFVRLIDRLEP